MDLFDLKRAFIGITRIVFLIKNTLGLFPVNQQR